MEILWFIPTHGDARYLGSESDGRTADHLYFKQVAQAADRLGYTGVLLPTGRSCEDPWLTASALAGETKDLKFFSRGKTWFNAAFSGSQNDIHPRPHFRRPAADQRCGRGDPYELAGDGLFISHDERYEATDEFLTVWRRLLQEKRFPMKESI